MGIKVSKSNLVFTNATYVLKPKTSLTKTTATVVETIEQNQEEITLVWLDVKPVVDQLIHREQKLREINDYCKFYYDQNSCIEYIHSSVNVKVFLVIPGSLANNILLKVHKLEQVDFVFIYCIERDRYLSLLNDYSKLVGIYTSENDLMKSIQNTIKLVEKRLITLNSYNHKQKSTRDLTTESGSFLFFQLFKDILMNMPQTNESKHEMIRKCRDYYCDNKKQLKNIELFNSTYQSIDAIQWYTNSNFPLYKLINKALRTEDINELFHFRFFIVDLSSNLFKTYKDYKKMNIKSPIVHLYRGTYLSIDELQKLKENVGNLISTNGFLSTSRCRMVATMFTDNAIFEIETDIRLKTVVFADVAQYSKFPDEQEVLFDIGAAFQIDSCVYDSNTDKKWIIKMTATDKGAELAKEYFEFQKKKVAESDIVLMFGHLLIEMGQHQKAQKYFENVLRQKPNDEEVACIYHNIGRAYRLKNEYERAIDNYNQSFQMHSIARPPRYLSAAKSLNGIGVVYNEIKAYHKALEYLIKALNMYQKSLQNEHIDIAGTLNNLGNAYRGKREFDIALEYLKRAQNINENILPHDHPNISRTYNNMGNIYYAKRDYQRALETYTKAITMNKKILPSDHPDITRCLKNLGLVHCNMKNYDQALNFFSKALEIVEKTYPQEHPCVTDIQQQIQIIKKYNEIS
ncbi:unnamed protein product [Didymodactylos carnosus]|uniref:NAD(P)(+)--arginine ADP-ribosyltransferase n=1 Tax=Didymodactylos carnosus TaxID=1234261 RepID=A0A814MWL8_9BILA|nr:unnamed protein product [Didymodactylos carnosus]CAF3850550.1 unnamed protein product [Didymodactylos carnosus]